MTRNNIIISVTIGILRQVCVNVIAASLPPCASSPHPLDEEDVEDVMNSLAAAMDVSDDEGMEDDHNLMGEHENFKDKLMPFLCE